MISGSRFPASSPTVQQIQGRGLRAPRPPRVVPYTRVTRSALLAALCLAAAQGFSQAPPSRIILGGRAVVLVANAVYAFPSARDRVIAVGGADQGLGAFLGVLDPGFPAKPVLDRNASAEVYAAHRPDLAIFKSSLRRGVGGAVE
ncbi:MAG TPA: hypothetical protein VLH39_04455, partial [Magnetospirillaceae bacterium]|nr:hypothetical protein [Magnetospirillaceae bacterium]